MAAQEYAEEASGHDAIVQKLGDGKLGNTEIDAKSAGKVVVAGVEKFGGEKVKPFTTAAQMLTGQDAPAPVQPGELVSDGFFDFNGNPLNNGVRRIKTYREIEEVSAPAPITPSPIVSPAPEKSAPSSSADLLGRPAAGAATSLPPPNQVSNSSTTGSDTLEPAQALGSRGTSSTTTARLVQVEARVTAIESPLAADLSNATAVVPLKMCATWWPVSAGEALQSGEVDGGVVAAGQVVGLVDDVPCCADLIERMVAECRQQLAQAVRWAAPAAADFQESQT